MERFSNKICLITASSTGIGLAIASRFSAEGATVIITSRDIANVNSAVDLLKFQGYKAFGFPCHVGKRSDRLALLSFVKEKFKKIDVLVHNAAVSTHFGSLFDASEQQFSKMLEINLMSPFLLTKECLEMGLLPEKTSNILILSSYAAYEPSMTIPLYSVTKTMLLALMKAMSKALEEKEIRVNCLAPGLIKTKFSKGLWEGKEESVKEMMGVNRLGEVEDIANAAALICSKDGDFIANETFVVAGKPIARL